MPPTTPGRTPAWRLADLARHTGLALHGPDREVTGLSADSRRVRPGELFVAVPGTTRDGASFVADALRAGAAAVCTVHEVPGVPTLVAADPRAALADLAAAFYRWPARDVSLAGITGLSPPSRGLASSRRRRSPAPTTWRQWCAAPAAAARPSMPRPRR
jgi:UDP-N-acetylmuramoyl-L-alanyl-D-glutamate--2,6-diaminopimelate ligase